MAYLGAEAIAQAVYIKMKEERITDFTKVMCIGDIITRGEGMIGAGTSNGQTWPARLKAKLEYIKK